VVTDRLAAARDAAALTQAVVVAKGFRTIIGDPDGGIFINPTGDAGLASGGSGDVLTGTIGAFLAQGLDPVRACIVGCWLHGRAGELGGEAWPAAVPASLLPGYLAQAWREIDDS
jgi:NAD(P)H-hydrate epimerase